MKKFKELKPNTLKDLQLQYKWTYFWNKYYNSHLNSFLHHIVDNEEDEYALTRQHKVVARGHITQQLDCTEIPGWNSAPCGRELNYKPA